MSCLPGVPRVQGICASMLTCLEASAAQNGRRGACVGGLQAVPRSRCARVVRDAEGTEVYRALPGVRGHTLTMRVPARALDRAAYPVTVDPAVSVAHVVSTGNSGTLEVSPSVAFDGTNFMVVWADSGTLEQVLGVRLNPAGQLLDPDPIHIAGTATSLADEPAIVWNGSRYLVAYTQGASGGETNVQAIIVSSAGTLVGSEIPIDDDAAESEDFPSVVGIPNPRFGNRWQVSWRDRTNGPSTRNVNDTSDMGPKTVISPTGDVPLFAINHIAPLTVWTESGHVMGRDNVHPPFEIAPSGGDLALATHGNDFLVTWDTVVGGNHVEVFGRRIPAGGTPVDPPFHIAGGPSNALETEVAWNGSNYLVAWEDDQDRPQRFDGFDLYCRVLNPMAPCSTPVGALSPRQRAIRPNHRSPSTERTGW